MFTRPQTAGSGGRVIEQELSAGGGAEISAARVSESVVNGAANTVESAE